MNFPPFIVGTEHTFVVAHFTTHCGTDILVVDRNIVLSFLNGSFKRPKLMEFGRLMRKNVSRLLVSFLLIAIRHTE